MSAMTDAEYLATYGDRSLDVQVAERLMGWTGIKLWGSVPMGLDPTTRIGTFIPRYSTSVPDAWRVWRECVTRFGHVEIMADMEDYGREAGDIVTVTIGFEGEHYLSATGDFARTICELALEADESAVKFYAGVQP